MVPPQPRVHVRPMRTVTALRALILLVLAGVVVWTALSWGHRGKPQASITMTAAPPVPAGSGPVVDQADRFKANGTREGKPAFDLLAQTVTGLQGDLKLLQDVNLTVHEQQGGTVLVASKDGQFDPTSRRAQLSHDVAIHTPDGLSLDTGNLFYDSDRDMIYTGDAIRFSLGRIEGSGQGMNYLVNERQIKIASRVRLRITPEDGSATIVITAGSLVASLQDNSAVFTDATRLERGTDLLTANYLRIEMDEKRDRITGMRAYGTVSVTLAANAAGQTSSLDADSLTLSLGAGDVVETAEASGGCRFQSGPYNSTSRTALFRRQEDRLELRGDPVVLTDRERIAAQEIDLRPEKQALEARGEVRTVSMGEGHAVAPGFGAASAVSFQAARLEADQSAHRAVYSGSARAWQEGTSLQAEEIVVDESERRLLASGNVISRFTPRPGPAPRGGAAARPQVTTVTARSMTLDDAAGTAHYEGGTRLTRPDATMTSDEMTVRLKEVNHRREVDRIDAVGSVSVKREGSLATAMTAELQNDTHLLILRDDHGLAEVVDEATGRSMRGRELTYDLTADRILTESVEGARTWITLTPDTKDGLPLDPPTRH